MRAITFEKMSFGAIFLSIAMILVYLALALELANGGDIFFEHSHRAAALVAACAMRGMFLTALLGLGLDWYMKKTRQIQ